MLDETRRTKVLPFALAALLGAALISVGAIAAVTATGTGMMGSSEGHMMGSMMDGMMNEEMMDKMNTMHDECEAMMAGHHGPADENMTASA